MYDKKLLKDILSLQDYRVVDNDGNLFAPSHYVYQKISTEMLQGGCTMTKKHIYTTLKTNRCGFLDYVYSCFLPHLLQSENQETNGQNKQNDETTKVDCDDLPLPEKIIAEDNFKVILSASKWASIKPIAKKTGQKLRLNKNKWTDVMAETIYQQTKIPCAFSFKKSVVYNSSSAKFYVKVQGNCNECSASLAGYAYRKPSKSDEDIIFHFIITNCQRNFPHSKRRHLRGDRREKIANAMINQRKAACIVRNDMANDAMEFGDPIPPTLPSSDVLRKAKQEQSDQLLGLSATKPIESLIALKHTSLQQTIRTIGADPFYCVYFSPQQIHFHKVIADNDPDLVLTADASGGFVFKIFLPVGDKVYENKVVNMKSSYIFLYVVKSISTFGNVSLYQMLSAKHDAAFLTYFFTQVLTATGKIPKKYVTDFSKALLVALARSYGNCRDLKHYLQLCYQNVVLKEPVDHPRCCLCLDVNHFVAQIARWKCLKGQLPAVRQLFLRTLVQVYQMTNLMQVEQTLLSLLTVALSPQIGLNDKKQRFAADKHLRRLNNLIRGMPDISEPPQGDDTVDETETGEEACYMPENICDLPEDSYSGWISWAKFLFSRAEKLTVGAKSDSILSVNPFFIRTAAKKIRELSYWLPLWTGIMFETFDIDSEVTRSSATIEAEFSKLKTHVFAKLPLRADRFVVLHTKYLEGEIKLAGANLAKIEDMKRKKGAQKNKNVRSLCKSLCEEENWKKKNKDESEVFVDSASMLDSSHLNNVSQQSTPLERTRSTFNSDRYSSSTESRIENITISSLDDSYSHNIVQSTLIDGSKCNFSNPYDAPLESTHYIEPYIDAQIQTPIKSREKTQEETETVESQNKTQSPTPVKLQSKTHQETDKANSQNKSQKRKNTDSQKENKVQKACTYLSVFPEWDCSVNRKLVIPIMKNGSCCEAFKDGKKRVIVSETCAFDSILLLVMQAANLFPNFKALLEESGNEMGVLALTIIGDGNLLAKHYKARYDLLKSLWIYQDQIQDNRFLITLRCQINAAHLSEYLFRNISYSCTLIKECQNCGHNMKIPNIHVPIDVQILLSDETKRVQAAIDEIRIRSVQATCSKCKTAVSLERKYGSFLLIDTSAVTMTSSDMFQIQKPFYLQTLDKKLQIDKDSYNIVGAVHFIEYNKQLSKGEMNGHYQAYFFNGKHWYQFDDVKQSRQFCRPEEIIVPHLLFYVKICNGSKTNRKVLAEKKL